MNDAELRSFCNEMIGKFKMLSDLQKEMQYELIDTKFTEWELKKLIFALDVLRTIADRPQGEWIPCSERLPSEEERKEWIDNNLDGIGYLYPCLVTRYSSINPDRTKNNPYVAKHYFDGEDFVNCGEEVCSEYILAWMPLPKPWKGADDE